MTNVLIQGHSYANLTGLSISSPIPAIYSRNQGGSPPGIVNVQKPAGVTLFNSNAVDRIAFSDAYVAFDYYGNAGECYRLYQAAFNRVPDIAGLSWNTRLLDAGTVTPVQLAAAFLASAEGQSVYPPGTANAAFITALYHNVLKRDPSTAEVDAWLAYYNAPYNYTNANVLLGFSDSAENHSNVDSLFLSGILMDPSYFA